MDSRFRGNDGGHMNSRGADKSAPYSGNDEGHMDSQGADKSAPYSGNDEVQVDSRPAPAFAGRRLVSPDLTETAS